MARKNAGTEGAPAATEKKQRWYHNVRDAYRLTKRVDPSITWILIAVVLGVLALAIAVGFVWGHPVYTGIIGLLLALTLALVVLSRRTEKAAFSQLEGQQGAVGAVMGRTRGYSLIPEEPVAINPRTRDLVFRLIGRGGVVLISEGPSGRVRKLLDDEKRKINRVAPNVPVHVIQSGNDEAQVPLKDLGKKVRGLKKTLTVAEVAEVTRRLEALGATRLPIPKGVDPMRARPDRKGMRGR